ncbi:MAG: 30S ribosomal protein S2 [Anaerolineae bacterium]|nr:30S ribosomal protein S2 [Anaerolineae bacterium]
MAVVSMRALLETGVHFGHRTERWHPKMKSYIFTERNGIHIIDLQQTISRLEQAYALVRDTVAEGGRVLFVGTKRQAQASIAEQAERCGMPYVNQRWLGGTLTNWRTIQERIEKLHELETQREIGAWDQLPKHEALGLEREVAKMNARFGGIKDMKALPDLLFVIDVHREKNAIQEANKLDIPVVAVVDTNCDPAPIDYVIPGNDDAIRAIKLMATKMADATLEGRQMVKDRGIGEAEVSEEDMMYLGEATLAKIRSGALDFEADGEQEDSYTVEYEEDVEIEYEEEDEDEDEDDD